MCQALGSIPAPKERKSWCRILIYGLSKRVKLRYSHMNKNKIYQQSCLTKGISEDNTLKKKLSQKV
jgi:hypothetical protein